MIEAIPAHVHFPNPYTSEVGIDLLPPLDVAGQEETNCPVEESPQLSCDLVQKENGDTVVVFQVDNPKLQLDLGRYCSQLKQLAGLERISNYNCYGMEGTKGHEIADASSPTGFRVVETTKMEEGFGWEYDYSLATNTVRAVYQIFARDVWVDLGDLYGIVANSLVDVSTLVKPDMQATRNAIPTGTRFPPTEIPTATPTPWFKDPFPATVDNQFGENLQVDIGLLITENPQRPGTGVLEFLNPEGIKTDVDALCRALDLVDPNALFATIIDKCVNRTGAERLGEYERLVFDYEMDSETNEVMADVTFGRPTKYLYPLEAFKQFYAQFLTTILHPTATPTPTATPIPRVESSTGNGGQLLLSLAFVSGAFVAAVGAWWAVTTRRYARIMGRRVAMQANLGPVVHSGEGQAPRPPVSTEEVVQPEKQRSFDEVLKELGLVVRKLPDATRENFKTIAEEVLDSLTLTTEEKIATLEEIRNNAEKFVDQIDTEDN